MGSSGMVEHIKEVNTSPDIFFEIMGAKKGNIPKVCPNAISSIQLLEGQWGAPGCVMLAHSSFMGKMIPVRYDELPNVSNWNTYELWIVILQGKAVLEAVDKKNKSLTYKLLEGDIMNVFKTLKITVQGTTKCETNFFKWTMEYEKMSDDQDVQEVLEKWQEYVTTVTKEVDNYYQAQGN